MAEEELKILVFTVLKRGAVLKNIFIVNRSPPLDHDDREGEGGKEEILTVGRHSNCSIVLTHPSVSRFHLQIYSNPSTQKLSVMDLSSVHGTWVSDEKIEPGEKVELTEGDILRVGASSRIYRLHWIPLSQAYDLDQPFVSASDVSFIKDKDEESSAVGEGKAAEAYQDNDIPEIECEELGEFNDPSYKREEHSPFSEREVAEASEDDGLLKVSEYEEVEKCVDPLSEVEKNLMIANGELVEAFQDEGLLDIENEAFVKFEDPFSGEEKIDTYQQDMLREDQEIHSPDLISGEMGFFTFNEASELLAKCEISTAPTMLEDIDSSMLEENKAWQSPSENDPNQMHDCFTCQPVGSDSLSSLYLPLEDQSQTVNLKFGDEKSGRQRLENEVSEISPISEFSETVESRYSSGKPNEETEGLSPYSALCLLESSPLTSKVILAETGSLSPQEIIEENLMLQQLLCSEQDLPSGNEKSKGYSTRNCEGIDRLEKEDILSMDFVKPAIKPLYSSFSEQNILSEVSSRYVNKENQPASSPLGRGRQSDKENLQSPPIKSFTKSNRCSIWSRRGKPVTALQLQTGSSRGKSRSTALNSENVQNCKENDEDKLVTRNLFANSEGEEEIFTPDKENMTPNTRKLNFLKEIGKAGVLHSRPLKGSSSKLAFSPEICSVEDVSQSSDQENQTPMRKVFTPKTALHKSGKASKVLCSPNSYPDEDNFHSSDKENQTPKFQRQNKRVKSSSRTRSRLVKEISGANEKERMPFQSLHSDMESHSSGPGALISSSSVEFVGEMGKKVHGFISNHSVCERKKSWIMVADTTSFQDKESQKALQLLEGLRGTQLVIPRMVLRELDTLKRQRSLFRRTDIFSVLEWIEETMINTNWWIHIQSSAEEGWAVAPTPRASSYSFGEASDNFSFSGEIASPTTEDRILEYALQVRKMNSDAQLVLLSNDISMKIKAMAEGLLCEAPKEFRESLVNPFSERFMWAGSSPRGQTWSLSDDAVLRDKNFLHPSTRPSRGNYAKGLKLILRHNSHYGHMKALS